MKPTLKLMLFIFLPALVGYLSRNHLSSLGASSTFMAMIVGGLCVAIATVEMIFKALTRKSQSSQGLQLSKLSGYSFLVGLFLFSLGLGYVFAA